MQHALRPYATAAVALTGAALVAVAPAVTKSIQLQHAAVQLIDFTSAASAAAEPADTSQDVANLGQSEISEGLTLYNQGDFPDALEDIVNGQNNLYIAAPQDAQLELTEAATQPSEFVYFNPANQVPIPTDESQLTANLQQIQEIGQNLLHQGSSDTAAGLVNLGAAETLEGNDDLAVVYPEEALYGPLYISAASQQLTETVASYEQQDIENIFQIAINSATPPPAPPVPPVPSVLQADLAKLDSDLVTLHHELATNDIFPGIPITDETALGYAGGGFEVHAIEGISLVGTLLDQSIDPADKVTETVSFFQSLLTP
jgi:hypothetical protein